MVLLLLSSRVNIPHRLMARLRRMDNIRRSRQVSIRHRLLPMASLRIDSPIRRSMDSRIRHSRSMGSRIRSSSRMFLKKVEMLSLYRADRPCGFGSTRA